MKAHELAAILLQKPDMDVFTNIDGYVYPLDQVGYGKVFKTPGQGYYTASNELDAVTIRKTVLLTNLENISKDYELLLATPGMWGTEEEYRKMMTKYHQDNLDFLERYDSANLSVIF